MRGEEFLDRRGLGTVRSAGQETTEKVNEISRCSDGEAVLAIADDIRNASAGQLEADGNAFGIGFRIAIRNLRHSGAIGEAHDHGDRFAAEMRGTTQLLSSGGRFKCAFTYDPL